MKITFLGTRGYIDVRTKLHYRHTSTLISYKGVRVMIDCGQDWLDQWEAIKPHAIILTHAHPDHAWGLAHGSPCPVYATQDSWDVKELKKFPIKKKIVIHDQEIFKIGKIEFQVFAVEHSIRCPAVGYRITAGKHTIFCVHDLVAIKQRHKALKGVELYIGDGATIRRPMVRKKDGVVFGHSAISTQLGWCKKEGVPRAIFTHCGTQIVGGDQKKVAEKMKMLAQEKGVETALAYDGLTLILR
jgi:phosphoribosyl 1,2-cyclic phosphodiesterase